MFSADEAERWAKDDGAKVILVRRETTPDDYHGMIAAQGILTSAGGTNSHAAVVARGEGIPAVCGADEIKIDLDARAFTAERHHRARGRHDHDRRLHRQRVRGRAAARPTPSSRRRGRATRPRRQQPIWQAFERLMRIADDRRRMRVRANADTPDQSTNARERGAEGIGLCRTEHMFLGSERVAAVQQMIFAETDEEEQAALRRAAAAAAG